MSDTQRKLRATPLSRTTPLSSAPGPLEILSIAPDKIPLLAAQMAPLHARLFDPGWDAAAFADLLTKHRSTSLCATTVGPPGSTPDHLIAGFIISRIAADEAEILTVGVAPQLQNNGLGRRLLDAMLKKLKARGAKALFLEVAATNAGALALYRSNGFYQVGQRNKYYAGAGGKPDNALVMVLDL